MVQGPRLGCEGCPPAERTGSFAGPRIDFAILAFRVLPTSLAFGATSSVTFTFQLVYRAYVLEMHLPEGFEACDLGASGRPPEAPEGCRSQEAPEAPVASIGRRKPTA